VVSWFFGIENEAEYGVNRTGILFNPAELRYAMPKYASKNDYLTSTIDEYLVELKSNPNSVYHESIKEHFGSLTEQVEVIPEWVNILIISGVVVLVVAVAGFFIMKQYQKSLKEQVLQKMRELKATEGKYQELYEASRDGIVTISPFSWKFTSGNNAAVKLLGVKNERDLMSRNLLDYSSKKQRDGELSSEKIKKIYENIIVTGSGSFEWLFQSLKGEMIPAMLLLSKVGTGKNQYFHAVIRDLSKDTGDVVNKNKGEIF
jgi:PAS domain-containing protein